MTVGTYLAGLSPDFPGARAIAACRRELKTYDTSKGTVRFTPDAPLPATLVRKLLRARMTERTRR